MQQLKYSTHINSGGDFRQFVLPHMVGGSPFRNFGFLELLLTHSQPH
jgi:hypothetical protein